MQHAGMEGCRTFSATRGRARGLEEQVAAPRRRCDLGHAGGTQLSQIEETWRVDRMKLRDLTALIALAALWGGSFLFMRIAAPTLGPLVVAGARVVIAGAALLVYAAAMRRTVHLHERWRSYLLTLRTG
jgi:hypothetical protein